MQISKFGPKNEIILILGQGCNNPKHNTDNKLNKMKLNTIVHNSLGHYSEGIH